MALDTVGMSTDSEPEPDLLSQIVCQTNDYQFRDFANKYNSRSNDLEVHLKFLENTILNGTKEHENLKGKITVSWRIKTEDSAKESLQRRQRQRLERQALKERLERCNESWTQYWKDKGKEYMIDDWGPYKSVDDMIDALPDIGGLRICTYFPTDVEAAKHYIEDLGDLLVEKPIFFSYESGSIAKLREHVEQLEKKQGIPHDAEFIERSDVTTMFNGYKAVHGRLQLENSKIRPGTQASKHLSKHAIEVQITTVVMNAWSEVVHNILYKPSESTTPQSIHNILDVFNGLVLCSEGALNQLKIIQKEEGNRLRDLKETPANRDLLSDWIMIASKEVLPNVSDPREDPSRRTMRAWSHLDQLLALLKSVGMHRSGRISELVKRTIEDNCLDSITCNFPLEMLSNLAKTATVPSQPSTSNDLADLTPIRNMALKLVKVLNMALYLGIGQDYVHAARSALRKSASQTEQETPFLIDMLALLHHGNPTMHKHSIHSMAEFCSLWDKVELDASSKKTPYSAWLNLPKQLVDAGFTAYPHMRNIGHAMSEDNIPVPRELCAFLDDDGSRMHWIPEILNVAHQMAGLQRGGDLSLEDVTFITSTHAAGGGRRLIRPGETRMGFFEETLIDNQIRLTVFIDNTPVPLKWTIGQRGSAQLHVQKKDKTLVRPHPGYFCAISQSDCRSDSSHYWKYTESSAARWTIKKLESSIPPHTKDIKKLPGGRSNAFFDLARSLNTEYGELERTPDGYSFSSRNANFNLVSREEEYILQQGMREETEARLQEDVTDASGQVEDASLLAQEDGSAKPAQGKSRTDVSA
ncbi:hypothetical protein PG991_013807 [Apiospora marii]|uniref:RelA/SpoT domain-containing protein n=1 Tax=Apiospora marii TaxID=335849 RepID=A0ABR1R708_9PEZI